MAVERGTLRTRENDRRELATITWDSAADQFDIDCVLCPVEAADGASARYITIALEAFAEHLTERHGYTDPDIDVVWDN